MKNRVMFLALLICVATAVVATSVDAQNKRIGTSAGTELLVPVGARDLAMGGSSIATSVGVEAIHWNPAGLGNMKSSAEGMFSHMTYIADIGVNYGAVGAAFGDFGIVALSVKSFDFGRIPLTSEDDPDGRAGRFFSPAFVTIGLTYARSLTDAIAVGGTIKAISEQIDQVSASGMAIDFGIQYKGLVGVRGLNLGVSLKNVGSQMKYDGPGLYRLALSSDGRRPEQRYKSEAASFELPSLVEIGLAYEGATVDNFMWNLNGTFSNNNLYLDEYKLGGEVGYQLDAVKIFGRAGMGFIPTAETIAGKNENIFGPSFGAGLVYAAQGITVTVDYAYRQVEFFDANNVLSLKFGF